jgi:hypothetical protein
MSPTAIIAVRECVAVVAFGKPSVTPLSQYSSSLPLPSHLMAFQKEYDSWNGYVLRVDRVL